ncbi:MAG: hypothetical protein NTV82_14990 [Candidatus Aminicenantes bacterium]|nr:hypothetical protein [Candidatus Aminicenantes bacterium]
MPKRFYSPRQREVNPKKLSCEKGLYKLTQKRLGRDETTWWTRTCPAQAIGGEPMNTLR